MKKKYFTEEERKEARRESYRLNRARRLEQCKKSYLANIDKRRKYGRDYYSQHLDERKEYQNAYEQEKSKTKYGRAYRLLRGYYSMDRRNGFGDLIDFDAEWIVENIFSKPCAHCGEEDWHKLGCNRLDNSKPHTKDNVEPCCGKCNCELEYKEQSKQVYQYTLDGLLVAIYPSIREASRQSDSIRQYISLCCNGKVKQHKGYKWSFEPL